MRKCMEEVVHLLKAKMQCIWIDSYEESEVIKDFKEIVNDLPCTKLFTWSHTEGLKRIALSNKEVQEDADRRVGVDMIFDRIREAQNNKEVRDEGIYILKDLHLLNDNPNVKRMIRDIKESTTKNYNPIIVVSPIVNIPLEHEKLFTIVHYDTPDKAEITKYVNIFVKNMEKNNKDQNKGYKIPTNDEKNKIISALIGLTFKEIVDTMAKSIVKYKELSLKAIMEEKIQLVKKSGVLDYEISDVNFDDIGGNTSFKKWLEEVEESMTEEAKDFGCSFPKGYLALGVPGTAKSHLAKAIANKWGVPMLSLNMSKIMNKLVGESEKKIEQAFRIANACAPCVFLIDEVEKALSGTRSSNASDSGTTARVFSTVLKFLNDNNGVFVIMTSNDVSQLPPELTRSGRLDAMWYFSLPTLEERKDIFRIHLSKTNKPITQELIDAAANATHNYTGAEIKEIVRSSMRKAFKRFKKDGNNSITAEEIVEAAHETIPIYESSKEKIEYLEMWVRGRARYTNDRIDDRGYNTEKDDQLLNDVLEDLQ